MSLTTRIFGLLDTELSQKLVFSITLKKNVSRPGNRTIRLDDRFVFQVDVRNDSTLCLKNVNGVVSPSAFTRYRPTAFELANLRPREMRTVATIEAHAIRLPNRESLLDHAGAVAVSVTADLSDLRFQEWGKALVHTQRSRVTGSGDTRSLPLSPGTVPMSRTA